MTAEGRTKELVAETAMKIVDDRVIARAALDAVKRSSRPSVHRSGRISDLAEAFVFASMALSETGLALTPEILRTLRADIQAFASDAKVMGRAYVVAPIPDRVSPANANEPSTLRRAASA